MPQRFSGLIRFGSIYNHMGAGHYDAVVPIPRLNETLKKQNVEQYCRLWC